MFLRNYSRMGSSNIFLNSNLIRPISIMRPYLYTYNPIKRYSKSEDGGEKEMERAPSLAQEFKRVEEEKIEAIHAEEKQGLASQTTDKAYDGAEEAAVDGDVDSVKERYKEHQPGADYHRNN
ncbi:uncharacterized protein [Euphorbia lathyris]|uniref:uncharacterized protein n=1 Tax=Euphorbia lathyris TaxID=212925 RepID=UPI0033136191